MSGVVVDVVVVEFGYTDIFPGLITASNSSLLMPSSTTWNLESFHSYSPGTAFSGILTWNMITGSSSFTAVGSPFESVVQ